MYACLAVTCHLHFWQNDRDFLRATVVTRGWNGYRNKSQHRKSTLEKKILPPFQQGFEPATFQSRVRCSNHWAIPAPLIDWLIDDRLYSAILRSLEQTHCARILFYISDWLFSAFFLNIHRSGVLTALAWLVPHETAAVQAQLLRSVYTIQPCSVSLHAKPHMCYNWDTIDSIRNNTLLAAGSCRVRVIGSPWWTSRERFIYIFP